MDGRRSKIPKLMEKGLNPRRQREMASGSSRIPRLIEQVSNPRTQRVQELRQRFEAPSNRPAESQRGQSIQRSQKARPNNRSRYRNQESGVEQQGPGPSSQVQAMRRKFDAPSKKPAESQKQESSRGSQRQRLSRDRGQGSRVPVQAMRQKYEGLPDKSARSQKDGSNLGSPKQRAGDRSGRAQGSGAERQDLGTSGNVQEYMQKYEAPSDKSGGARKEGSRQDSRRKGQGSGEKEVTFEDSLNIRPGSSHPSEHSYPDSLEERDRPPSFREIHSSTPQPGQSGGANGGIQDQSRSAQDYEFFYHNNMEKVKNYDLLNLEIVGILSQYIPGINAEDRVSPTAIANVLRDFIADLHEDLRNAILELDNLKEQVGGQYPQEDSTMGSSQRSRRRLSGYQASSSPSYDSYHGGPPRPQLRRRRMRANDYDLHSTASPEFPPIRRNLRANVPQHSSIHAHDPQSTHSSLGLSSRLPSSGPPSQRSTRSPSHRGPVETDELMSTNEMAPGNERFGRPGAGHYHSDIEEFIATRRLEPRANTSNARMEELQAQLREFNLQNQQSSSGVNSTTDDSHDSQPGHSEPSMADDDLAIYEPLDYNAPGARSPAMLGRVWNPREMDLQLQRFNTEPQQGSSRRSPDSFQEQSTDSSASVAPDVGNENRVRSPGMFGRLWNPQDMNEQLERINVPPQQESRGSEQFGYNENATGGFVSPSHRSHPSQENQDFPWNQPQFSNLRENNESPPMRAFYDNAIDLGSPRALNFEEEPQQEDISFEPGEINFNQSFDIPSPPHLGFPPSHSFSPSAFEHYDPSTLEEYRYNLEHPPEIPDEDFQLSVPNKMDEPPPNLEIMEGVVRRRRPSDRSHLSQEHNASPSRDEPEDFIQQPETYEHSAMWRVGDEPQNPSFRGSNHFRNAPYQQEYDSGSEEEWDAGCY